MDGRGCNVAVREVTDPEYETSVKYSVIILQLYKIIIFIKDNNLQDVGFEPTRYKQWVLSPPP